MNHRFRLFLAAFLSQSLLAFACPDARAEDAVMMQEASSGSRPSATAGGGDSAQVAVITSLKGSAVLMRGGAFPTAVGVELRRGDTLVVDNGSLGLVFMSGSFATIVGGEKLLLGDDLERCVLESNTGTRGPKLDGTVPVPAVGAQQQRRPDEWRRKLAYAAGVRGDAGPVALSPRLTLASATPEFVWFDTDSSSDSGQRRYVFVLRDAAHRTLMTRTVSGRAGEHTVYSPDALPPGFAADSGRRYSWGVFREGDAVPDGALDAHCVYVDPAGLASARRYRREIDSLLSVGAVDSTSAMMLFVMRQTDERERLFADAVPALVRLARQPAAERWALEQLISIYLRFGNSPTTVAAVLQRRL